VLALDPGADGKWTSFTFGGPADTTPVVQGIKLIKVVPRIDKCPDLWPGRTFVQAFAGTFAGGTGTGIRTFFPLKYTPCDTTFTLQIEIADITNTVPKRPLRVRENRFVFRTTVRPETLEWVVDALHCQPLGVCEVPCITDEGLYQTLITQSRAIATAKATGPSGIQALNTALDVMEATIVRNCMFQVSLFRFDPISGALDPCALFRGELPGNNTISRYQFGIVDTIEHPCCCKLISDIVCLKNREIGGGQGTPAQ
jgi:hypothetical protein